MWQELPPEQPGVGVACHMRLIKMAVRSMAYSVLTDGQKRVLSTFYDKGMTSTGVDMRETIMKAADETETSYEKVKVS